MGRLATLNKTEKTGWPWDIEVDVSVYNIHEHWPKISIVTPSFNQGEFIEETIRSIVLQNYPNLEYIVMDGESTDASMQIVENYKSYINVCISEKDEGQSHALQKGFALASKVEEDHLMNWINSDDILCEKALFNIGKAYLERGKADFIHGKNGIMDIDSKLYQFMPHPKDNLKTRYLYEMPYGQQAIFFKRSLYEKIGGVNRDLKFSMDFELYLRMHLVGIKAIQIDEQIGNIRIHSNTKTATLEAIMRKENGDAMLSFFKSKGYLKGIQFLTNIGHEVLGEYRVGVNLQDKKLDKILEQFLAKNIWYYYERGDKKIAASMVKQMIQLNWRLMFNLNYLKIIKDGRN